MFTALTAFVDRLEKEGVSKKNRLKFVRHCHQGIFAPCFAHFSSKHLSTGGFPPGRLCTTQRIVIEADGTIMNYRAFGLREIDENYSTVSDLIVKECVVVLRYNPYTKESFFGYVMRPARI